MSSQKIVLEVDVNCERCGLLLKAGEGINKRNIVINNRNSPVYYCGDDCRKDAERDREFNRQIASYTDIEEVGKTVREHIARKDLAYL